MNTVLDEIIGATITVQGRLYDDKTRQPLTGVTVTLVDENNEPVAPPSVLAADSNTFSVWTDETNVEDRRVLLQKSGYAPVIVAFDYLYTYPEVFMQPLASTNLALIAAGGLGAYLLLSKKKKSHIGKFGTEDAKLVVIGVGGLVAFTLLKKLLEKFGIWEGAGTKSVEQQQTDPNSAWKPAYWRQFNTYSYVVTLTMAQQYVETIHDAFGVFSDDYNAIWSVFTQMRTKANVSFLCEVFLKTYDEDLLTFLTNGGGILPWDGLSEDHLKTITDYVNRLPTN